ncbi:hypothetical protein HAV15_011642 [Penicillium sp. str. |nr:hypothetical protein HAV15_011642 [Penicillium sp. str. \
MRNASTVFLRTSLWTEIITLIRSDIESKARPTTQISRFPYHGISHAHLQLRIGRPNNTSTRTSHRSQLVICHATSVTEYEVRSHQLCINNVLNDFSLELPRDIQFLDILFPRYRRWIVQCNTESEERSFWIVVREVFLTHTESIIDSCGLIKRVCPSARGIPWFLRVLIEPIAERASNSGILQALHRCVGMCGRVYNVTVVQDGCYAVVEQTQRSSVIGKVDIKWCIQAPIDTPQVTCVAEQRPINRDTA